MGVFEDVIESTVHETVERCFEDGNVPRGLMKAIETYVESVVEKALERLELYPAEPGRTSREEPRVDEQRETETTGVPHTVYVDKNSEQLVYHEYGCKKPGAKWQSYRKCDICHCKW